jgi:hypothetical protein
MSGLSFKTRKNFTTRLTSRELRGAFSSSLFIDQEVCDMKDQEEHSKAAYQPPTLTVYGSAETITAEGNSANSDGPRGPDDPPSFYST